MAALGLNSSMHEAAHTLMCNHGSCNLLCFCTAIYVLHQGQCKLQSSARTLTGDQVAIDHNALFSSTAAITRNVRGFSSSKSNTWLLHKLKVLYEAASQLIVLTVAFKSDFTCCQTACPRILDVLLPSCLSRGRELPKPLQELHT